MDSAHLITDLPPEILVGVFSFIPGKDLPNVCKACTKFRDVLRVDSIWQIRCKSEYNFISDEGWHSSYYSIYTKVLYRYGSLLSMWQRDFYPYGGFAQIKYDEGRVLGVEYHAPLSRHIRDNLLVKELFSITITPDDKAKLRCLKGYHGPHPCNIIKKKDGKIKVKCLSPDYHRHPQGKTKELNDWVEHNEGSLSHLSIMKFEEIYKQTDKCKLQRMELPVPIRSVPIQPGLFKGHYGAHGIEVMALNYVLETQHLEIQVLKITGDPNVPALTISLFVDLQRPMVLNLDQQESMHTLKEIDTPDILLEEGNVFQMQMQEFSLPRDCYGREQEVPPKCMFRFHGKGRIAGHGYHDPQLTPGHFMVFDDNTFGFIWMELWSFSLYSRVMEKFD